MNKFKVGDFVKGKINEKYTITNEDMIKGKVIKVYQNGLIDIKIIEHKHKEEQGEIYKLLESKYFDLIDNKKYEISDVLEELKQEIKELQNKIDNLISYTNSLDRKTMESKGISKEQQDLLISQVHAMMTYHSILKNRIEDLEVEKVLKKTLNTLYGKFAKEDLL